MGAWHQLNLNLFKKALSVGSGKLTSELKGIVEEINKKEQSFEKLSDELVKRSLGPVKKAMKDSGLSKSDIDEVILVGGSTRIPIIQKEVEALFGKKPSNTI